MKAKEVVNSIATSQNIPVNPVKQSHMIVSFPKSMHTPLVQLTKSHSETGGEGVGETKTELAGMVLVAIVEKGMSKLSELEMKKKIDDVVLIPRSEVMVGVGVIVIREDVLDGSKISQSSPVNLTKH